MMTQLVSIKTIVSAIYPPPLGQWDRVNCGYLKNQYQIEEHFPFGLSDDKVCSTLEPNCHLHDRYYYHLRLHLTVCDLCFIIVLRASY